jgi:hypothetical protein
VGNDVEAGGAVGWVFIIAVLVLGTATAGFLFGFYAPELLG